jgi:hypothetical protein
MPGYLKEMDNYDGFKKELIQVTMKSEYASAGFAIEFAVSC